MHILPSYTLNYRLTFSRSHISLFNFFLEFVPKPKPWNHKRKGLYTRFLVKTKILKFKCKCLHYFSKAGSKHAKAIGAKNVFQELKTKKLKLRTILSTLLQQKKKRKNRIQNSTCIQIFLPLPQPHWTYSQQVTKTFTLIFFYHQPNRTPLQKHQPKGSMTQKIIIAIIEQPIKLSNI